MIDGSGVRFMILMTPTTRPAPQEVAIKEANIELDGETKAAPKKSAAATGASAPTTSGNSDDLDQFYSELSKDEGGAPAAPGTSAAAAPAGPAAASTAAPAAPKIEEVKFNQEAWLVFLITIVVVGHLTLHAIPQGWVCR